MSHYLVNMHHLLTGRSRTARQDFFVCTVAASRRDSIARRFCPNVFFCRRVRPAVFGQKCLAVLSLRDAAPLQTKDLIVPCDLQCVGKNALQCYPCGTLLRYKQKILSCSAYFTNQELSFDISLGFVGRFLHPPPLLQEQFLRCFRKAGLTKNQHFSLFFFLILQP